MNARLSRALILLTAAVGVTAAIAAAPAGGLDAYRWRKRVILVFAPAPGDSRLARQRDAAEALIRQTDDRDLVLVQVAGDRADPATVDGAALRRRFRVAPGAFRALLIGKDGSVKLNEPRVLEAGRLGGVIDAMPMRREEMTR